MAADLQIAGRAKMKRDELLAAVETKLYGSLSKAAVVTLNQKVRDERHRIVSKAA